jgi:hypothetical protein
LSCLIALTTSFGVNCSGTTLLSSISNNGQSKHTIVQ